ncbi:hypothetical protein MPLB_1690004 [Mesorhizobium sp. ORS 3324]|nr:hypothetical protein MPLB_1690004 [Mesorhizobium sp. ORS 3324]
MARAGLIAIFDRLSPPFIAGTMDQGMERMLPRHDGAHLAKPGMVRSPPNATEMENRK